MKFSQIRRISKLYFKKKKRLRLQVIFLFSLMFFIIYLSGFFVKSVISTTKNIFSTEENTVITVIPERKDLGMFKVKMPNFLDSKSELSLRDVKKISKYDGVSSTDPVYTLKAPSNLTADLFNMRYGTDLSIFGESIPFEGEDYKENKLDTIPVAVNSKIIDIYNLSFAPANDLPLFSEKVLKGKSFDVSVGMNSFTSNNKVKYFKIKIGKLSPSVEMLGITLPTPLLKRIANNIDADLEITGIRVRAKSAADMTTAADLLKNDGYTVKTGDNIFANINRYIAGFGGVVSLPSIIILIILLFYLSGQVSLTILGLRKEIGMQFVMGLSIADIRNLWLYYFFKSVLTSAITGGVIGLIATKSVLLAFADTAIVKLFVPDFSCMWYITVSLAILLLSLFIVKYVIERDLKSIPPVKLLA